MNATVKVRLNKLEAAHIISLLEEEKASILKIMERIDQHSLFGQEIISRYTAIDLIQIKMMGEQL